MMTMRTSHLLAGIAGMLAIATATPAHADDFLGNRTNGLAKDVAVRHRRLLVAHRLEFTPLFETTVNAAYQSIIGGGAKLEYHISDRLSIGVIGVGSTAVNTALTNRILPTLMGQSSQEAAYQAACTNSPAPGCTGVLPRAPSQQEFLDHLNTMPIHGAAYLSLTPWYGKLAAFSSAFVAFDFYFQAGVSIAQLDSNCPQTAGAALGAANNICWDTHPGTAVMNGANTIPAVLDPNVDPPLNNGFRAGLYLGGGVHVFLNDFLALDLTVRDYAFEDNPSGADVNADLFVGPNKVLGDDNRFLNHLFFGAGLSIMLPTTVKRTP
jgi:outer membrane beta-barrel protein